MEKTWSTTPMQRLNLDSRASQGLTQAIARVTWASLLGVLDSLAALYDMMLLHTVRCMPKESHLSQQDVEILRALLQAETLSVGARSAISRTLPPDDTFYMGETAPESTLSDDPPTRYERVLNPAMAVIGRGGVGEVVAVYDRHLRREVAWKELQSRFGKPSSRPRGATPPTVSDRFLREARITAGLEHPGVVPIYELGQRPDGTLYYTMKRIRGRTFAEAIANAGSLSERLKLMRHFVDLCQAVAYAHNKGVIHRDLKPSNVMVGEFGETIVLDWGLARVVGAASEPLVEEEPSDQAGETLAGTVLGTPAYMSPEQARGDPADFRSDVWSLGAILYNILANRPPYLGDSVVDILENAAKCAFPPVQNLEPDAPPELVAILKRALAANPERRFPTARELAAEVEAWRNGVPVASYAYTNREIADRFLRQNRMAVTVGAFGLIGLLIGGFIANKNIRTERDRAIAAEQSMQAALFSSMARQAESRADWGQSVAYWRAAAASSTLPEREAREISRITASRPNHRVLAEKGAFGAEDLGNDRVAVAFENQISIFNVRSGERIADLPDSVKKECFHNFYLLHHPRYLITVSVKSVCRWSRSSLEWKGITQIEGRPRGPVVSGDGRYLASGGDDIIVTDLDTGKRTMSLPNAKPGESDPGAFAFAANVPLLAVYSEVSDIDEMAAHMADFRFQTPNRKVYLFDARDGKKLQEAEVSPIGQPQMVVSPDGSDVVIENHGRLVDWMPGTPPRVLDLGDEPDSPGHDISAFTRRWITFSPIENTLFYGGQAGSTMIGTRQYQSFPRVYSEFRYEEGPQFSPDGTEILFATGPDSFTTYRVDTGHPVTMIDGIQGDVGQLSFGSTVVATTLDGAVHVWNRDDVPPALFHGNAITSLTIPSGKHTIGLVDADGMGRVWPQWDQQNVLIDPKPGVETCLVVPHEDGTWLAIRADRCRRGHFFVVEKEDGSETQIQASFLDLSVSPNGRWLVVGSDRSCSKIFSLWENAAPWTFCGSVSAEDDWRPEIFWQSQELHFTPHAVIAGNHQSGWHIVAVETGKKLCDIPASAGSLHSTARDTDLLVFIRDFEVTLWDSRTCSVQQRITGEKPISNVVVSSNGTTVALSRGLEDTEVYRGGQRIVLPSHGMRGGGQLSDDGTLMALRQDDNVLQVIDTQTGITLYNAPTSGGIRIVDFQSKQVLAGGGNDLVLLTLAAADPQEILRRAGQFTNLRLCKDSLKAVAVVPFPPSDTIWAPPDRCYEAPEGTVTSF